MACGKCVPIVDDYPDALDIWAIYLKSIRYGVSTSAVEQVDENG